MPAKPQTRKEPPSSFFREFLPGEQPLSPETGRRLCLQAARFLDLAPWTAFFEDNLVFIPAEAPGEMHACSVMGARGEVFALFVYLGMTGYRFFERMHSPATSEMTSGEFFASQHVVYVDYERASGLTRADRELLDAAGYPRVRGQRLPIFRVIRPGYHPWYVTENEAAILLEGLRAAQVVFTIAARDENVDPWAVEGSFPLATHGAAGKDGHIHYSVVQVVAPQVPPETIPPAAVAGEEVAELIARGLPRQGVLEIDEIYSAAKVGEKGRRPACVRLALAVDAGTGLAYAPDVALPEKPVAGLLASTLLKAIEQSGAIPVEVRVRKPAYRAALQSLAAALGIKLTASGALRSLDTAKREMLAIMGEEGPIPIR